MVRWNPLFLINRIQQWNVGQFQCHIRMRCIWSRTAQSENMTFVYWRSICPHTVSSGILPLLCFLHCRIPRTVMSLLMQWSHTIWNHCSLYRSHSSWWNGWWHGSWNMLYRFGPYDNVGAPQVAPLIDRAFHSAKYRCNVIYESSLLWSS